MADIIGDTGCPACIERGQDKTQNHLILFDDGGAYCNRCGYSEGEKTFTQPKVVFGGDISAAEAKQQIDKFLADEGCVRELVDRGINEHACEHFNVLCTVSETDGTTVTSVNFPSSKGGKLQGFKTRYPNKRFGKIGIRKEADFFGSMQCPRNGNKLFITEGEYDALALYQTLFQMSDAKWRGQIAVVSLANGSGSADKEMIRNADLIKGFKEVVLVFDQDEAGKEAVEKAIRVLGRDTVKVVGLTEKDANEMVKQGKQRELYFSCITEKATPRPEKIISGNEILLEDMMVPLKEGLIVPYPKLSAMMGGFRYGEGGGELSVVCAGSGMGKTTLAREIMYCFNKDYKLRLGHIFLEEQFVKTSQSYIAIDNNTPLAQIRVNPACVPRAKFEKSRKELIANDRTFFLKHFGSLSSDTLIDYLMYMGVAEECNFILLDHISMVISGQQNSKNGERKDIDILMTKLAAFCEDTGVSVMAVVHLKRPQNGCFNDGQQVSLAHLRGSAAIEQLSHNIIAIEGDQHGDNPNHRQVRVLKNREWGNVGEADTLSYNPDTGRLLTLPEGLAHVGNY